MKYFSISTITLLLCFSCSKSNYQPVASKPVVETPNVIVKNNTEMDLQSFLKATGATIDDLIKYVSIDTECPSDKIVVKEKFEQLGNGVYLLSVCGKDMKYKRTGSVFFKDGEDPTKYKY